MKNRIGVNPKTNQRKLTIKLLIRKMKKFIYAISAFAVIFAVGCSKDEVENPAPEYDIVVNMEKPSFGDDTRAARTSWEDGDEVYVVFNGDAEAAKYLKLTYNAGTWSSEWAGTTAAEVAAKETKTLVAGYMSIPLAKAPYYYSFTDALCFDSSNSSVGVCVMLCNNGTYTVSGNTITLDITIKPVVAQVTVRGIDAAGNWVLKCDKLTRIPGFFVSAPTTGIGESAGGQDQELYGFANTDGVSFYGRPYETSTPTSLTFTLTNGVKTYTRTFTNKTLAAGDAIIMDGPSPSSDWVDVTE